MEMLWTHKLISLFCTPRAYKKYLSLDKISYHIETHAISGCTSISEIIIPWPETDYTNKS